MLAPRVLHAFRDAIRRRGDSYVRAGAVKLVSTGPDAATARVSGSMGSAYRVGVHVRRRGARQELVVSCTCPHFERGEACKHLWATLRVLDMQGWRAASLERGDWSRISVVGVGDGRDDGSLEPYEREGRAEEDLVASPVEPASRSTRPQSAWRARIRALASPLPSSQLPRSPYALAATAGAAPLLYLIDPDAIARERALRVYFARRPLRRDGSAGALRQIAITADEGSRAPTAEEAALLAQLLVLAQARLAVEHPYQAYTYHRPASFPSAVIPPALLDPLLPRLADTGRLGIASLAGGAVREEPRWLRFDRGSPWQLRIELARATRGYELRSRWVREGEVLALDAPELVLSGDFLIHGDTLVRAETGGHAGAAMALRSAPITIPAREVDAAIAQLASLPGVPPLDLTGLAWKEQSDAPRMRLRLSGFAAERARAVAARLDFGYGDAWVASDAPNPRVADVATRTLFARDGEAEARAFDALAALGVRASAPQPNDLASSPLALPIDAFDSASRELLAKGWIVEVEGAALRRPGRSSARVRSGIDFFDLEGGIDFDGEQAPFPALLAAAREGARFVRLGDGSHGLLPKEWIERCARLAGIADEETGGRLRFRPAQASFLDALLSAQDESRVDRRFAALRRRLASFGGVTAAREPTQFEGTLRGYQREGLGWLEFLERFGIGGCLADDMGLGKTVQVLALLLGRAQRRRQRGAQRPSLVVAPRSVVYNWADEAQRFAPRLRVLRYAGGDRAALREQLAGVDLVVTSYGTLLRDAAFLCEQRFDYAILDEAQAIKNERSKTARTARTLRADHRLALTGTPVENHLGELGSLLEFLNPGLLGRSPALGPLAARTSDPASLALLARALRPLLLRRTKAQVLPELPAKTEQTVLCDLLPAQRRHYEELRRHFQASLAHRIAQRGLARSKIHVLEALLRLRQASCHSALLDARRADEPSAKLEALFERIDELLAEDHKALVFSQFTSFLSLVRRNLDARGIPYAYLDGKTRDREQCVARFESDPQCRLFLISLKAGGTGLNLTAADYVFLLDPWWNPAVEAQAIDRTHRIGQTRPVMAYRLVARDTIEEKILVLQQHKRGLAEAILTDDASLISRLTADDLQLLLG